MANIKSAKKRILVIKKKTALNRQKKSEIRTYMKKLNAAIENGNVEEAKQQLRLVEEKLNKAAQKGILHKNAVARKVSRMTKRINGIA